MKKREILLVFILFSLVFSSCGDKKSNPDQVIDSKDSLQHKAGEEDPIISSQADSTNAFKSRIAAVEFDTNYCYNPDSSLPFGCGTLVTHDFPSGDYESEGFRSFEPDYNYKPHVKETYDVISCYNWINSKRGIPNPYNDYKIEHFPIGSNKLSEEDDFASVRFDSCKYKLPNFGPYESFYSYNEERFEYGYLLLMDHKKQITKVINVYYGTHDDYSSLQRFFYINEKKEISIYTSYGDEAFCNLKKVYSVEILDNGEILLTKNN